MFTEAQLTGAEPIPAKGIAAPTGKGTRQGVSVGVKGGVVAKKKWRRIERGLYELPPDKDKKPRYAAEWVFQGRKIRRRFSTLTKARKVLDAVRGQIVEDRYIDRRKETKTTLQEAISRFIEWGKSNISKSTQGHDALFASRWEASPHFRGKTLDEIRPTHVESHKLAEKASHGIRQADYSLARLRRFFNLCIAWELCEHNPVSGGKIKFFNPKGRRDRYVTPEEETVILDHADPRVRPAITFSLHTGLRQNELIALTWNDLDSKVGQFGAIKVTGAVAKDREDRHIPLTETARKVLNSIPRGIKGDSRIFSFLGTGRANLNRLWFQALMASKVNEGASKAQRITWHTLRHTYASRLVMEGVDLATVRELMGHSNVITTMRYAHLARHHVEESVLVLDRIGKHSVNMVQNSHIEPGP